MRSVWGRAGVVLAVAVLSLAAASGSSAAAAAPPVRAGLSITPTLTTVGSAVRVVATATNTTTAPVQASLGINNYGSLRVSAVSGSAGCSPRNLTRLVYCGVQSLAPNATATITLSVVPAASGSFDFRSYARITYTTDDSFAYATLLVS
jgi:hypothetical protein